MANNDLTVERLREFLHYDPSSDKWMRIAAHKMRPDRQGMPAGNFDNGYLLIKIGSARYKAHRLVWLWTTGEWPSGHIDHIDGNRSNNRFENLRDASRGINAQNQRSAHKNSQTGLLGVNRIGKRYMARLALNGNRLYLGTHDTPEAAYTAYLDAKRILHPGNTL